MKKRFPHKSKVLLVNITRLGDMLQATPTIAGMKEENPDCEITVLVEKQFEGICKCIPNIDKLMALDLGMIMRSLAVEGEGVVEAFEYVDKLVEDLRSREFDYCLNMSSSAYTAILINMLGIKNTGGWTADADGYRVIESDWAQLFATSVSHQNREFNSLNLVDVFRCSADVEKHPQHLLIDVEEEALDYCKCMIAEAGFTNRGPLVCIQAGASQPKRQWAKANFVRLINDLVRNQNARVVLSGAKNELSIIEPIKAACNSENIFIAAGKTNIPQLAALLKLSDILVTGDTGPMHVSVAVGTPVVSLFLASAYGFETGPYSEGNIIIQPLIGCGPCNPNKKCSQTDCHEHIEPELVARLTALRLEGDFKELPADLAENDRAMIYRSYFDEMGFCDLKPLNKTDNARWSRYRRAYRKLWLDDLAGFADLIPSHEEPKPVKRGSLALLDEQVVGLSKVVSQAEEGVRLIEQLASLIQDPRSPGQSLNAISNELTNLDTKIAQTGFHYPQLGPLTRMFIFGKENISGSDPLELASQMRDIYQSLERRGRKLDTYYSIC